MTGRAFGHPVHLSVILRESKWWYRVGEICNIGFEPYPADSLDEAKACAVKLAALQLIVQALNP